MEKYAKKTIFKATHIFDEIFRLRNTLCDIPCDKLEYRDADVCDRNNPVIQ